MASIKEQIEFGKTVLGIELGSTRIKTVLIGEDHMPVAEGAFQWENQFENSIWTYPLEEAWKGIQIAYQKCMADIFHNYQVLPVKFAAIGISAMMHGYLIFDEQDNLLTPFRTWRNTNTKEAAARLTELFQYNIPQRWSIAHLYQAVLKKEAHVPQIRSMMTLSAYVHYRLTRKKVIGIGDASGMFPIDRRTNDYNKKMIHQFEQLEDIRKLPWRLEEILPRVLKAGEPAGVLTEEGSRLLDPTGRLQPGIPFCPPEGDAQTGMVATNTVHARTGNVSAGTSNFAILILEKELSKVYREIDLVASPSGMLAANIHCNNCTTDLNAWVNLFQEFSRDMKLDMEMDQLYHYLYQKALTGEKDAGGVLAYNYYSGEGITNLEAGRPILLRKPDARFQLSNFMRANLYASLATLKIGIDIITKQEAITFDHITAHGGLFKTKEVGQKILAAALDAPVTVMEYADQGGAWGIALLAAYLIYGENRTLEEWLDGEVFAGAEGITLMPDAEDVKGFEKFMENYIKGLTIEREATVAF